jgi:hypothetical protein
MIQVLLAISAHLDLEIHQVNIKITFLNGELKEEIYLKPLPGLNVDKTLVWRLLKPLYNTYGIYGYWFYVTQSGPQCLLKGKRR